MDDFLEIMLFVKFGKKLVAPEEVLGFLLVPLGPLVPVLAKYFGHDKIIMIESICRLVWDNKKKSDKNKIRGFFQYWQ